MQLAALGLFGPAGITGLIQEALAKGDVPTVSGINSLSGNVTVNGVLAKSGTVVKAGDKVSTSANSMAVVVIGKDGFLLRDGTSVTFEESKSKGGVVETVLLTTGKILSVFAQRVDKGLTIKVPNATVGIRGTGCYLEVQESRTYFCLCYGQASVSGIGLT